jgi:hypothetical protein
MTVTVQLLTFAEGLYAFLVRSSLPAKVGLDNNLVLPAVHVARGPDAGGGEIEFLSGTRSRGNWLGDAGDVVMARITGAPVTVLLTSLRVPGAPALGIEIQRVDGRSVLGPQVQPAGRAASPAAAEPARLPGIGSRILAHVQNRGDMVFADELWAGLPGQRLWIESFSIEPGAPLAAADLEYKGLTATGFETPWLSGGAACGTRGMGIPLVAFSVRIKPSAKAALYDCEYSASFLSGAKAGPMRNGAPCRSPAPDDPLEAIQLRILERRALPAVVASAAAKPAPAKPVPAKPVPAKPRGRPAAKPRKPGARS